MTDEESIKSHPRSVGSDANRAAVLIPAFNESKSIGAVVRVALEQLSEVLVVDDGSDDGTADVAMRAGAGVLRQDTNLGVGAALKAGIRALRGRAYPAIVCIDGDGAHDPAAIPNLLDHHFRTRADLTIGSRYVGQNGPHLPCAKRSANRFAAQLVSLVMEVEVSDAASGMRVLGPRVGSLGSWADDYGALYDMLRCAAADGLNVTERLIVARYDAKVPWLTRRTELLGLLRSTIESASERRMHSAIERAIKSVEQDRNLTFQIRDRVFFLHVIKDRAGYLIQEQHPFYAATVQCGQDVIAVRTFEE